MSMQPGKPEMKVVEEIKRRDSASLLSRDKPHSLHVPAVSGLRVDWGDALAATTFYGREEELARLTQWIMQESCRVVSLLGLGGIGKSALSVSLMYQLSGHFEIVIFRSLRDAPSCEVLLDGCLQVLSPPSLGQPGQAQGTVPTERRIRLLLEHLHKTRVLLVLDNLEGLLKEGDPRGHFRPGFEAYGLLLNRVAETSHQSCLLLTSRERPAELRHLENRYSQVRTLRLTGLDNTACQQLFKEKEVVGTSSEQEQLIEVYAGNPLALKIVAETIVDLFDSQIGEFLSRGKVIFDSITDLLGEHFARLTPLEQSVLCWLAIGRELMTLDELLAVLVKPLPRPQVLEAIDSLRRRSLIEPGKRAGSFTLQSVVLEYVAAFLIAEGSREIKLRRLDKLIQYGLSQAHAKEYVRQTQERLLLSPLLTELQCIYPSRVDETTGASPVEAQLLSLLGELRKRTAPAQGYGPANLIALLWLLRGSLNGLDLSHLSIRGMCLQNVEMHRASLAEAFIRDSVWTSAVSITWALAISPNGQWWIAGSMQGKVSLWDEGGQTLQRVWQAHTDMVHTLAFSPDGQTLASGSTDGTVKLWEVKSGTLLWAGWHHSLSLAFSPDGNLLASGGTDATVQLWDAHSGTNLQALMHSGIVFGIAFSPDGSLLASGCTDGQLRLWERQKTSLESSAPIFSLQTSWVTSPAMNLTFAPDGKTLVSTNWDRTITLWEVGSSCLLRTLPGKTDDEVMGVAWSPDGYTLACCSYENAIRLWDVERDCYRAALHGHTAGVYQIAFTPDSSRLLSGSTDGNLRVWNVENGQCIHIIDGYAVSLYDIAWSPDGKRLVSGATDGLVTIWDVGEGIPLRELRRHRLIAYGVEWSPDGRIVLSGGWDKRICLWNPASGGCVEIFEDFSPYIKGVAWSPDGSLWACGTVKQGVQVWDGRQRRLLWVGQPYQVIFSRVAWSPDGTRLVSGGDDGSVYLWESEDGTGQALGTVPTRLPGHQGWIMSVGWSPDGMRLASCGGKTGNGELFVWNMQNVGAVTGQGQTLSGHCLVQTFEGHLDRVYALAWSPGGDQLISGGGDGLLRWWDVETAECVCMREADHGTIWSLKVSPDGKFLASCGEDGAIRIWDVESGELLQTLRRDRPYERLNITGIRGLTEAQKESLLALGAIEEAIS